MVGAGPRHQAVGFALLETPGRRGQGAAALGIARVSQGLKGRWNENGGTEIFRKMHGWGVFGKIREVDGLYICLGKAFWTGKMKFFFIGI